MSPWQPGAASGHVSLPRSWRSAVPAEMFIGGCIAFPIRRPGIAFSNGRLEADDIDTRSARRLSKILADESTLVQAGQVAVGIDTRGLREQLALARAQIVQAR